MKYIRGKYSMEKPPSYDELKKKYDENKHAFNQDFSHRIRRALSWIKRAKYTDDSDGKYIFLWIAFDALHADPNCKRGKEFKIRESFLMDIMTRDAQNIIKGYLKKLSILIQGLMGNRFIFMPFWDSQHGINSDESWESSFENDNVSFHKMMKGHNTEKALIKIFKRLNVLRNQLVHGGATWDSNWNRNQVCDGTKILDSLVPVFVSVMMSNPDQDWGEPWYPEISIDVPYSGFNASHDRPTNLTMKTQHTSSSTHSSPVQNQLNRACYVLEKVSHQLQTAVHVAKEDMYRKGKLDENRFDQQQSRCYTLAVISAELEAARVLLEHAKIFPQAPLLAPCALGFCVETVKSTLSSFVTEGATLDLDSQQLQALLADDDLNDLLKSADGFEQLAAFCIETGNSRLETGLDESYEQVRSNFQRFAEADVAPLAEAIHRQDQDVPDTLIETAANLGCFGTCIPERFGGLQPDEKPDSMSMIIVTEELSRGSLGAAGSLITRPEIAARALLAGGTQEQQQTWLPMLASGEKLCAISITEPDTGSDVAAVSLRASACEGGWLLNGSKTWCTFAGRSELVLVLARTGQDPKGHRGLSLFLVEKPTFKGHEFSHSQPQGGVFSGKAIATLGYRGMHSYTLFFDDYFVPTEGLLGGAEGQGKGFYYTMAGFAGGRLQTAARATGLMQAAFDEALQYTAQRRVFNHTLGDYQLTRLKLSRMLATITACRQFSYAVARLMDAGKGQMEASLVKLFACRAAEWVTREAMQLHGGMGYAEETAVSRYFVDARVLSIFEGTEEVLAIRVIAKEMMEQHNSAGFALSSR